MKKTYIGLIIIGILFGSSIIAYILFLENFFNANDEIQPPSPSGPIIINHTCAHLEDLKSIPDEWILKAKKKLPNINKN